MKTQQFKDNVKSAAGYLAQAGVDVPHTQLLEAISKAFGERNWSTMRAFLEGTSEQAKSPTSPAEAPTWNKDDGPMSDEYFALQGGNYCPHCGSGNIESEGLQYVGEEVAELNKCYGCRSTWTTSYVISGYDTLVTPSAIALVERNDVVSGLVEDVRSRARKHQFAIHSRNQAREHIEYSNDLLSLNATPAEIEAAVRLLAD